MAIFFSFFLDRYSNIYVNVYILQVAFLCFLNLHYRFLTYNWNQNENYENELECLFPNILKTFSTI